MALRVARGLPKIAQERLDRNILNAGVDGDDGRAGSRRAFGLGEPETVPRADPQAVVGEEAAPLRGPDRAPAELLMGHQKGKPPGELLCAEHRAFGLRLVKGAQILVPLGPERGGRRQRHRKLQPDQRQKFIIFHRPFEGGFLPGKKPGGFAAHRKEHPVQRALSPEAGGQPNQKKKDEQRGQRPHPGEDGQHRQRGKGPEKACADDPARPQADRGAPLLPFSGHRKAPPVRAAARWMRGRRRALQRPFCPKSAPRPKASAGAQAPGAQAAARHRG